MNFAQRFSLVLLAAFFLSTIAATAGAWMFTAPILKMTATMRAGLRAWVLAGFRLLPSATALGISALVLGPGYFRHEQRADVEGVGMLLTLSAAGGAFVLMSAIVRAVRAAIRTAALRRDWLAGARSIDIAAAGMPAFEIDSAFPLVAVLGAIRPRLFISASVLRTCPAEEIAAIAEHERGHVRTRDNAMRLLMDAAPDLLGVTGASTAIAREWHRAAEHRADEAATERLTLASALVRVARISGNAHRTLLPASALYRGEGVEERVRRLLDAGGDAPAFISWPIAAAAASAAFAAVAMATSGRVSVLAHTLLETLVSMP